ncbi:PD-(D/E)XK nuclease-like domain-containing protein [Lactococcus petauri]|uniref:PD-(D/E)XK nuclease-like domain-containing protein n=1 Tax=Lactococcus petauri TaxID=1940789 RepID=UPI003252F7C5
MKTQTSNNALDLLGANYYTLESSLRYWSVSQFKDFKKCQAAAMAKLSGKWQENSDKTALIVGNYVHSYFESLEAHKSHIEKYHELMISKSGKTKGELKASYKVADTMIMALENDKQFMSYYQGEKEVAVTGFVDGVEFKGKIDCLNVEKGYFVDIKTTRLPIDETIWSTEFGARLRWFEEYGYVLQMAVYQELLHQTYNKTFLPIIYAVTKEDIPDTRAIAFKSQEKLNYELGELNLLIRQFDDVKKGTLEPESCGHCDFCKSHKLSKRIEIY